MNTFRGKLDMHQTHLLSVSQLKPHDVLSIFSCAEGMKRIVEQSGGTDRLKGKIMAALFYEPSSRTMASFVTAMQRLGGGILPFGAMRSESSVVKGETIEDTARVFSSYADILVIRHDEVGAPHRLASSSSVPVVNAGDGSGEHPTQAILDAYTIQHHFSSFSSLRVGLIGDLLYGRTVHSLILLLTTLGVRHFSLISPCQLRMPDHILVRVKSQGVKIEETEQLAETMKTLDVIYMTRVQKERFRDKEEYQRLKDAFVLDKPMMRQAKKSAILMHPLPRVHEISPDLDCDPRSLYFSEQMRNGMYVRMALLDLLLMR